MISFFLFLLWKWGDELVPPGDLKLGMGLDLDGPEGIQLPTSVLPQPVNSYLKLF